jgi:hypothetical protein
MRERAKIEEKWAVAKCDLLQHYRQVNNSSLQNFQRMRPNIAHDQLIRVIRQKMLQAATLFYELRCMKLRCKSIMSIT